MRKKILFPVVGALAFLVAGSILLADGSKKISRFGFKGESGSVKMIVDTETTRLRAGEELIPLLVWLGHSEPKVLKADRQSFTLVGPDGTAVKMASYEEFVKKYPGSMAGFDHQTVKRIDDYGEMSFLSCKKMGRVLFFPDPGRRGVLYDSVEMPNRSYFRTLLYFPNSSKGADGAYNLVFEDASSGVKLEVPFTVEWFREK